MFSPKTLEKPNLTVRWNGVNPLTSQRKSWGLQGDECLNMVNVPFDHGEVKRLGMR